MSLFFHLTKSYNLFFLLLSCVALVPDLSPFDGASYVFCIVLMLGVSIAKDLFSEIRRYRGGQTTEWCKSTERT